MQNSSLMLISLLGGILLAAQGVFNSQLGVILKNPLFASVAAFLSSSLISIFVVLMWVKDAPSIAAIKQVPLYLWFTGSLLSVLGISLYYYAIPKLGISRMISLGLTGQILFSLVVGHFGVFDMPVEPITLRRTIGVISMIISIFLINFR